MAQTPTVTFGSDEWQRHATNKTTFAIIGKLESVGILFQFLGTYISVTGDPYVSSEARTAVLVFAFVHLPIAVLYLLRGGPFAKGGRWLWIPCLQALLFPILAALLTEANHYGQGVCTPLCNYAAPTILFLAMYLQILALSLGVRIILEILIVAVPVAVPYVMVLVMNTDPSMENYSAMFNGQLQLIVGYFIGRAAVAICRVAVARQIRIQEESFQDFKKFVHSVVLTGIESVRSESPNLDAMHERLDQLQENADERILQSLFMQERVSLAYLIGRFVRMVPSNITIVDDNTDVGGIEVSRTVGMLVSRALGDTLKNVIVHGGNEVSVRCTVEDLRHVKVETTDNGPGFSASVLGDPATNLNLLKRDIVRHGGTMQVGTINGRTTVHVTIPLAAK